MKTLTPRQSLSRMQVLNNKENRRSHYLNQRYASEAVIQLSKKQGDTELDDDDDEMDDPFILIENRGVYEVADESRSSGTTTRYSSSGAESYLGTMDLRDIQAMTLRTKMLVILVLCLGIVASALFMTFGILNSKESDHESFETRANELIMLSRQLEANMRELLPNATKSAVRSQQQPIVGFVNFTNIWWLEISTFKPFSVLLMLPMRNIELMKQNPRNIGSPNWMVTITQESHG